MSNNNKSELLKLLPNDDILAQCMHCGMCLPTCPTYDLTKIEKSSPRGRISLIRAFAHGELELTPKFKNEIDFCLDCQACESACPAGVKYGSMVESVRNIIDEADKNKITIRFKKFLLNTVLGNHSILKVVARLLRFYQKSGFRSIVRMSGVLKLFGTSFPEIEKLSPEISEKFTSETYPEVIKPYTNKKFTVAFPHGCLMDVAFANINTDTIEVLKTLGCEIIFPKQQSCCGSLHAHNGEGAKSLELARKTIDSFEGYEFDYLISNSAGCGAFMKEYGHQLSNDEQYRGKAKVFSSKVKDITEFLDIAQIDKSMLQKVDFSLTYHDACHLYHTQKVTNIPIDLIKSIPDVNFTPLNRSTHCCGSAGIYNVVRYSDAVKLMEQKMENIKATKAEVVVTGNPGCMGQIIYGVNKQKLPIRVMHTATLFREVLAPKSEKN